MGDDDVIPEDQFQPDDDSDRAPASVADQNPQPESSPVPSEDQPEAAPDTIPEAQFTPDEAPATQAAPDAIPEDQFQPDEEKYGTAGQEAAGYAEAAGRGLAGPLLTEAETHLFGVNPQDIAGREASLGAAGQAVEAGTFAGSMLLGTGEAALFAKAADAAAHATEATGLAASFLSNALQTGAFIASQKGEKAALGQLDPQETASHALLQDGAISLLGGAGGAAIEGIASPILQKIGDSEIGSRAAQFMSNLGSRLKFWQSGGGDMAGSLAQQMEDIHANINAAKEATWGPTGVKARNVQLLTQEDGITADQVNQHLITVNGAIRDLGGLANDPDAQFAIQKYQNAVNTPIDPITLQPTITPKTPDQIFMATDQLKKDIGNIAYERNPLRLKGQAIQGQAQDFYSTLQGSLENQDVWGRTAQMQSGLNSAFSEFKPTNDNFLSKFTEKDATDINRVVSPGKVNTYVNQLGKPQAEIKQGMVGDWANAYENYANQVNSLHAQLGIESPMAPVPTDLIKQSAQQTDAAGDLADQLYNFHINRLASHAVQGAVFGAIGEREGGWKGALAGGALGLLAPALEGVVARKIRNSVLPFAIQSLTGGAPEALGSALRYGESAARGSAKLSTGINALFRAGGTQVVNSEASDSDKNKLDGFVSNGELNNQLQEQVQAPAQIPKSQQHFADGGEVTNPNNEPTPMMPTQPALKSVSGIAKSLPDHANVLAAAKVRVNNYLNSIRPQKNTPKLAFDSEHKNGEQHRSYQKALDLAVQPIGILNHMKAGTMTPETLKHFTSMWPELHDHISKKLTERITKAQMDEEKPSYRVRQSMSLFMGAPLDSTMTPQAIQSIQSVYAPTAQPQAGGHPPKKPRAKKDTAKLGEIPKDHYTQSQAAAGRATQWD